MSSDVDRAEEHARIREQYRARLADVRRDMALDARKMLALDIRAPRITGPAASDPNAFIHRANQIGLALFDERFFTAAEQLYAELAKTTRDFRTDRNWRHAGALYANQGTACWAQGNVDHAIELWIQAAQEDRKTYGQQLQDSFAMSGLFEEYVRKPAGQYALRAVRQIDPRVEPEAVEGLCFYLRDSRNSELEFAFMAYVVTAHRHGGVKEFPNPFSAVRTLDALRNLGCLLEVELKSLARHPQGFLYDAIRAVFKNEPWWRAFQRRADQVNKELKRGVPLDEELRKAINRTPADQSARLCQSTLVAYIVRNYVAHWIDTECTLVQEYSEQALGHILHVMIVAASRAGH